MSVLFTVRGSPYLRRVLLNVACVAEVYVAQMLSW